jgi:hypothetical protein
MPILDKSLFKKFTIERRLRARKANKEDQKRGGN